MGKHDCKAGTSKGATAHRRSLFVEAYIANGGNCTDAAIKAGFSPRSAKQRGFELVKDRDFLVEIERRRAEVLAQFRLTTERTLQELARIAFFDIRKLFNGDGSPKAVHTIDDDTAAAVVGLEVVEVWQGTGKTRTFVGYIRKYKIANKVYALDNAMRHLGLFEKDNKQKADPISALLAEIDSRGKLEPEQKNRNTVRH